MHARRVVRLLAVAALFGAGCGGGGDGGPGAGGTPAVSAAPVTSPPTTDPALAAKATAAVLQPGDFPAGWKPVPEDDGGGLNIERLWAELTRCLGVDASGQRAAVATSPTFLRGLATQARSTVEYTSAATTGAITAALDGPKFQGCAKEAFDADVKRSAPEGGVPGPVAVAPLDAPRPAPQTYTYRVTVTINLDELKVPLFQDFFVMFTRGAVIRMLFLNPGSEFPRDLERSLVEKVVART